MSLRFPLLTATLAVLVVGLAYVPSSAAAFADDEEVAKVVKDLAAAVASGKVPTDEAKALSKKKDVDFEQIMVVFKPKKGDNLEAMIQNLAKKEPTKADVKKSAANWVKVAELSRAIAEVTDHFGATRGKKAPDKWKAANDEAKKFSEEMAKAAKAEDGPAFYKAVKNLNDACIKCHEVFKK